MTHERTSSKSTYFSLLIEHRNRIQSNTNLEYRDGKHSQQCLFQSPQTLLHIRSMHKESSQVQLTSYGSNGVGFYQIMRRWLHAFPASYLEPVTKQLAQNGLILEGGFFYCQAENLQIFEVFRLGATGVAQGKGGFRLATRKRGANVKALSRKEECVQIMGSIKLIGRSKRIFDCFHSYTVQHFILFL